ncbi:hypothetical protein OSH08_05630 [Kaistia geumhonensis]|uniref:Uncharacterized protein n=1 Tax=Kaistia geumhonensis TaxID=410839 RepID=A0ABU0M5R6_9HYPH|nr:hypothetical protein [Kaistia geumhonensis]MCX5478474.1 hypothetical protein [Kaistia geumhonensis]MDQ0516308.1 hypothetical protein [Kaistia geumhonensis]
MDATDLPSGLLTLIKDANRQVVLAAGGPAVVQALTGLSAGSISRIQGDAYPDLFPVWAIALIEFKTQKPIFGRLFATLTQHQLAPIGEGEEAGGHLVVDLVDFTVQAARVSSSLGSALADNIVTPKEAKATLAEFGALERQIDRAKGKLAPIASGRK